MIFFPRLSSDPFAPWTTSVFGTIVLGFLPPLCALASLRIFGLTLDPAAIGATLAVPGVIAAGASVWTDRSWAWSLFYGLVAPAITLLWWCVLSVLVAIAEIFGSLPW